MSIQFFNLVAGEMCFRFNHQDTELTTLMRELLQSTSSSDARAVGMWSLPAFASSTTW